jgi:hypothetical protein
MATVWVVNEVGTECEWPIAVYDSEAEARRFVADMNECYEKATLAPFVVKSKAPIARPVLTLARQMPGPVKSAYKAGTVWSRLHYGTEGDDAPACEDKSLYGPNSYSDVYGPEVWIGGYDHDAVRALFEQKQRDLGWPVASETVALH